MDVTKIVKDAAYVTVGFGVLAFQKAQVRRRELEAQLEEQRKAFTPQIETFRTEVEKLVKDLEERFEPVIDQARKYFPAAA